MKKKESNFFIPNIVYVLLLGLTLRILLSLFGTLQLDQGTFIAWSKNLVEGGFKFFYHGWSDYLPGYPYILWLLGKINLLGIVPEVFLYKIPAIVADILTGYLIYIILRKSKILPSDGHEEKWGIFGAIIYIFNPAILVNSTLWGQVDSLTALSVVAAVYFLSKNSLLSVVALAIGTLIKPQAAFILPVILFLMYKNKWNWKKILGYLVAGLTVFVLGFVPFSEGNLIQFILNRLNLSASQYLYTSVNAYSFWGLFGFWKADNLYFQMGGYLFVATLTAIIFLKFSKKKISPYFLLAFVFGASFIFFTRMHERHLLPVFAPLAIIAVENPIFMIPYIGFSLSYLANMAYSYLWITKDFVEIFPGIVNKFFIITNISLLAFMFYAGIKNLKLTWQKFFLWAGNLVNRGKNIDLQAKLPPANLSGKKAKVILLSILIFAFVTRVFNLGNPTTMYFDEVYHAFTAKVILHGGVEAWEWWNTPPEGFAYEWTHPPLSKLGMVLGMMIFGDNTFGYRIPGALLGVGAVFLIYLIAKRIFKDEIIGLLAAGVFSFDGLPLVLSRMAMNDSYILFFSLLSIYMFMRNKDFLSALSFGLALASKWSALWTIPIIFVLWLKRKEKFKPSILWFLLLPFAVYLASYLPMFTTGHDLSIWWGMQKQMWWYHTGLDATHPYSSPWWSWPFLIRPIYLYTSDEIGGMVSRIYAMGNPFVFWFGVAATGVCAIYSFLERNKKLGFVVFSYLIFFAPWAASPRIMFFYHYLPSIPFMSIAIAYVLRRSPKMIWGYLLICLAAFVYFYPHWAGLNIPLWLDKSYYWVSSWR